jgi:HK97 family phage major capsid protein
LYDTGTGHFAGFFSTSGIVRHNVAGATDTTALDAIEQAIEQMRSGPALAEPDLFITSPSSWSALRRTKDDLHRYILSPDPTREEANQLWGVPVLLTTQCNPGDGLLIDTTKFGKALVREGLVMRQGTNLDDFSRNLMRWVVELHGNLAVERPPVNGALPATPARPRRSGGAPSWTPRSPRSTRRLTGCTAPQGHPNRRF